MTTYFLGIDASKGYADFVLLDHNKHVIESNFQLDDTFDGHEQLYRVLSTFLKDHPDSTILAAIESTGGYENNWYHSLVRFQGSLSIQTARLNPEGVHANSRAELNRNITDQISAQNVAEYVISHPGKVTFNQEDPFASVRKLWSFYKMLVKQRTQLYNQLEKLIYSASPELMSYCKNGTPQWVLKVLAAYPTSAKLGRAQAKTVAKIPYVSLDKATVIIQAAKQSIAASADASMEAVIKMTVTQILHLNALCNSQMQLMSEACPLPEVELLTTFTGISKASAIGLMIELQTASRFKSAKKLSSFFGIHPVYKDSGDGTKGYRMSKKGRKEPRSILYMIAMSAVEHNPLIKEVYEVHLKNGMTRKAALGVCMHKTLRIVYGMLKHNLPFDAEIDRANQKRSQAKSTTSGPDKKRRFQPLSDTAPISGRQHRNRNTAASDLKKTAQSDAAPAKDETTSQPQASLTSAKTKTAKSTAKKRKSKTASTPDRQKKKSAQPTTNPLSSLNRSRRSQTDNRKKETADMQRKKAANSQKNGRLKNKKNDEIQSIINNIKSEFFA